LTARSEANYSHAFENASIFSPPLYCFSIMELTISMHLQNLHSAFKLHFSHGVSLFLLYRSKVFIFTKKAKKGTTKQYLKKNPTDNKRSCARLQESVHDQAVDQSLVFVIEHFRKDACNIEPQFFPQLHERFVRRNN